MVTRPLFIPSACLLMAACATTPDDPNGALPPACNQTVNCFYERNIRSFQVLNDRTVVVLVGRNQCPFKLELDGVFCDISFSSFLAFDDPDGRICTWDRTVVASGPFARADEYCRVRQVTPMTDDELLEAYATSGLAPPLPAKGSGELEVVEESPADGEQMPLEESAPSAPQQEAEPLPEVLPFP